MTTPPEQDITGVTLVGGKSRRMGQDKAFLEVAGKPPDAAGGGERRTA